MYFFPLCCSDHRGRKNAEKEKDETKSSVSKETKPSEKPKASVLASKSSNSSPISKKLNKQHTHREKKHRNTGSESQKECDNKECSSSSSKRGSQGTDPQAKEGDLKERASKDSKEGSEKRRSCVASKDISPTKERSGKDAPKQEDPKHVKKPKQKPVTGSKAKLPSDEEFEPPTMSFESYLNYDQVTKKRKRKACSTGERPKKCSKQKSSSVPQKTTKPPHADEGEEKIQNCEDDQSETPSKKVSHCMLGIIANKLQAKECSGLLLPAKLICAYFKQQMCGFDIGCMAMANNFNWGKKGYLLHTDSLQSVSYGFYDNFLCSSGL